MLESEPRLWSRHVSCSNCGSAIEVIPFGEDPGPVALDAFARFGKGRHPARLNFGDCLTYAVARLADEPLLCLGNDFAQTDLTLAQELISE